MGTDGSRQCLTERQYSMAATAELIGMKRNQNSGKPGGAFSAAINGFESTDATVVLLDTTSAAGLSLTFHRIGSANKYPTNAPLSTRNHHANDTNGSPRPRTAPGTDPPITESAARPHAIAVTNANTAIK